MALKDYDDRAGLRIYVQKSNTIKKTIIKFRWAPDKGAKAFLN